MAEQLKRSVTLATAMLGLIVSTAALYAAESAARLNFATVLKDPAEVHKRIVNEQHEQEAAAAQLEAGGSQPQAKAALANWWLAIPTARPATRWLLGVETKADRDVLAQAGEKALSLLASIQDELDKPAPGNADDAAKQERSKLQQSAENLAAFAAVFKLAAQKGQDDAAKEAWNKAARGLAVAREASDADVAAAAQLWQAFALARADRRDSAMKVLPEALAKPERLPYDLMSRLLRCRLMAEAGQQPAAVVLLGRMEPQLKTWMNNQGQDRNNARRLVGLVQYRIVQAWQKQLRTSTQPAAADQLDDLLRTTEKAFAEVKSPRLYYMPKAVPIKVTMPAAKTQDASTEPAEDESPDSRPASKSASDE